MTIDGQETEPDAHLVRQEPDHGRGVEKLNRLGRSIVEISYRVLTITYGTLVEFFSRREVYPKLAISVLYAPIGLLLGGLAVFVISQIRPELSTPELNEIVLAVLLIPIVGFGVEFSRERFLGKPHVEGESGWLNRFIMGTEVTVLYLLFGFLAGAIAGSTTGGVASFLPSTVLLPTVDDPQNGFVIGIDHVIANYVFPAGFILYLYNEKLSDLWPPSQFTPILVDKQYLALTLVWSVITLVGTRTTVGTVRYAVNEPGLPLSLRIFLAFVVAGVLMTLTLFLSLFTIAANAGSISALADETGTATDSTVQSTICWFIE